MVDWDELRDLIKDRMEPTEVVELLELTVDDLLDAFKENIYDNIDVVLEELGIDSEELNEE